MSKQRKPQALFTRGKVYHQEHDFGGYMANKEERIDLSDHVILPVPSFPAWLAKEIDTMVNNWGADMNIMTLTLEDDGLLRQDRFKTWCQNTFEGESLADHYDAGVKAVMVAMITGQYHVERVYSIRKTQDFMEQSKESPDSRYLAVHQSETDAYTFSNIGASNAEGYTTDFSDADCDRWLARLSAMPLEKVER